MNTDAVVGLATGSALASGSPYPLQAIRGLARICRSAVAPSPPRRPPSAKANMAACPAATTARVRAAHLLAGSASWLPPPRCQGSSARMRASELQQAPASAPAAATGPAPTHKVTVHDRQHGVVHEFVVPQVCTGAKSENQSKLAARKYARIIQKLGFPAKFKEFKIQNIVGSCDVKFPIRLEGLAYSHGAL